MTYIYLTYGGDPIYNIAMEEILLDEAYNLGEKIFRIWIQDKTVVMGYTTGLEEVNIDVARKYGVPIVRRHSGGGAVYHDMGNINISLYIPGRILNISKIYEIGSKYILHFLESIGLDPWIENRNDIVVDGFKVSGSSIWIK